MPNPTKSALTHLKKEPNLQQLIEQVELDFIPLSDDVYASLVRAIIYQQLSGKAASTIYGRFMAMFSEEYPFPEELMGFGISDLRAVGLSNAKANYVQNVAGFFLEHKLISFDWESQSDAEILQLLTQIKGVGEWTVQMMLMFTLGRQDVLPLGDLAIQQSMQKLFDLNAENKRGLKKLMEEHSQAWRPHRTLACRYLWAWKDQIKR